MAKIKRKTPINKQIINNYAVKYLTKFNTSSGYLRSFLIKKIKEYHLIDDIEQTKLDIDEIIANLNTLGFLNDTSFCEARIKSLLKEGNPLFVIKIKLQQKNIDTNTISNSVNNIINNSTADLPCENDLEEYAILKYAKRKQFLSFQYTNIDKQKVINTILRKGFKTYNIETLNNYSCLEEVEEYFNYIEQNYNL
ncbi:hypothetical protein ACFX5K_03625 [Rickettsiales bacterium LUAb2]